MTAIHTWFRMADLAAIIWIPAFAGMTGIESAGMTENSARVVMTGVESAGMTEIARVGIVGRARK